MNYNFLIIYICICWYLYIILELVELVLNEIWLNLLICYDKIIVVEEELWYCFDGDVLFILRFGYGDSFSINLF